MDTNLGMKNHTADLTTYPDGYEWQIFVACGFDHGKSRYCIFISSRQ
jgi:hypothetical protein